MSLIPMKPAAACMCVIAKQADARDFHVCNGEEQRRMYMTLVEDGTDVFVQNGPGQAAGDFTALLLRVYLSSSSTIETSFAYV